MDLRTETLPTHLELSNWSIVITKQFSNNIKALIKNWCSKAKWKRTYLKSHPDPQYSKLISSIKSIPNTPEWNTRRVAISEFFLDNKLSTEQVNSLINAHTVGSNTATLIRLRKHFSPEASYILVELGICGSYNLTRTITRCKKALPTFKESIDSKSWILFDDCFQRLYTKVDQKVPSSMIFDGDKRCKYWFAVDRIQRISRTIYHRYTQLKILNFHQLSHKGIKKEFDNLRNTFDEIVDIYVDNNWFVRITINWRVEYRSFDPSNMISRNQPQNFIWTKKQTEELFEYANQHLPLW